MSATAATQGQDSHAEARQIGARLLSGGAWALLGRAVLAVTALVANVILARLLSPAEFGTYFLAVTIVSAGGMLAQFGLGPTLIRVVAIDDSQESRKGVPSTVLAALLASAGIGALLAAVLLVGPGARLAEDVFHSGPLVGVLGFAAAWMIAQALVVLVAESFRGLSDIRMASLLGPSLASLLNAVVLAAVFVLDGRASLEAAVFVGAGAAVGSLLLGGGLLALRLRNVPLGNGVPTARLLSLSMPILVANGTLFVLNYADVVIVGAYRGATDVGVYAAAQRLAGVAVIPFLIMDAVVPPMIASQHARGNTAGVARILRTAATLGAVPAMAALCLFAVAGGPILSLIYGDFYAQAALILVVLAAGDALNACGGSAGMALLMTGRQRSVMFIMAATAILGVVGSVAGVTYFGTLGVAVATSLAVVFQKALLVRAARREVGVWTHASLDANVITSIREMGASARAFARKKSETSSRV
ncbi:MAG: oligosaccharide flippase family protein [Euryarchaeota archaeon]|nr:oligosaccharide flippase family protein [Euryarchaeota archaeon]